MVSQSTVLLKNVVAQTLRSKQMACDADLKTFPGNVIPVLRV